MMRKIFEHILVLTWMLDVQVEELFIMGSCAWMR